MSLGGQRKPDLVFSLRAVYPLADQLTWSDPDLVCRHQSEPAVDDIPTRTDQKTEMGGKTWERIKTEAHKVSCKSGGDTRSAGQDGVRKDIDRTQVSETVRWDKQKRYSNIHIAVEM